MGKRLLTIEIDAEEKMCGACVRRHGIYCHPFRQYLAAKHDYENTYEGTFRLPECIAAERQDKQSLGVDLLPGELYSHDGWTWRREQSGEVMLRRHGAPVLTVPADVWASIVASVSLGGEMDGRFYAARDFHDSKGQVDIATLRAALAKAEANRDAWRFAFREIAARIDRDGGHAQCVDPRGTLARIDSIVIADRAERDEAHRLIVEFARLDREGTVKESRFAAQVLIELGRELAKRGQP